MELWLLYAIIATVFAGLTSVLAKFGIQKLSSDLGLAIRTIAVLGFVLINLFLWGGQKSIGQITSRSLLFLILSGFTTAVSWICYYRAMQLGSVSWVAAIDKGSIVITILLSVWLLKEPMTPRLAIGGSLILAGLLVLVWK
jgi:transporter family protein